MNDQTSRARSASAHESAIELLARETDTPVDTVQEIYRVEHDRLESSARIKTFVSALAHRRVKALLQVERGKRHRSADRENSQALLHADNKLDRTH